MTELINPENIKELPGSTALYMRAFAYYYTRLTLKTTRAPYGRLSG